MNENNTEQVISSKQRRRRSSAAQKLLIIIMLAALAVLGGVIYHSAKHPHAAEIIDQLNKGVTTAAPVPVTTSETTSAVTETTTGTSETTTSAETTTEEVTTETTTASGMYSTSFSVEFQGSFGGQYTISVVYPDSEEKTVVSNIKVPETTYMEIELSYPEAKVYVPAQVYLTNELNGKEALAGTVNLDFANDLCDQSGLDIYTALLQVQ